MSGGPTRINLCGRLRVEIEGKRLEGELPGRLGRLLFAYLVLHRERPVRRDEIADALWPGGEEAQLAPPLSRLRKALGPGRIEGRSELSLVLPGDAVVDWELAQRVAEDPRRTVALAEQGLLPGLEAPWIDARRAELADLRVEALEAIGDVASARAAVEAAPFRESARVALMQALRAQGNVAEALRVYEEARTLLRDELGTAPGPVLLALHGDLLAGGGGAPAEGPASGGTAPPSARGPAPGGATPSDLVERDREMAQLDALLRDAQAGEGRVAVVEGPAGIGKSRLVAELRRRAEAQGVKVLSSRAGELEREFPFGVARQLFEPELAGPERREQILGGAAAAARGVFGPLEEGAPDGSFSALNGLFWVALNTAAERPAMLLVDDLHWCDRASLRFLAYLARRLEGLPLLLVTTVRTGETPTDAALLDELAHDPDTVVVRPGPLTLQAVAALVRDRLGADADPAFTAACHDVTAGNPLLVRQVLRALETDGVTPDASSAGLVREIGPRAVSRTVLRRLTRLPGDAKAVARAVAVLGENAELPAIAELAAIDEQAVARATAQLSRAEILRHETPLGFVHALVRDAVYNDLPPGERELQHMRAAVVLRTRGAEPEHVATHLLIVPPRGDASVVDQLARAADAAVRRGAPDSAVTYLRRALREPPPAEERGAVVFDLGSAEELVYGPLALEHLAEAYETHPDPRTRAVAAIRVSRTLMLTSAPDQALAFIRRAQATLPGDLDDEHQALEALAILAGYFGPEDARIAAARTDYPLARRGEGPGARMLAGSVGYDWMRIGGGVDPCVALAREAVQDDRMLELDNGLASVAAPWVLVEADLLDEAMAVWARQLADAHANGSLLGVGAINLWTGYTLLRRGELAEAEESLWTAKESIFLWGQLLPHRYIEALLGEVLFERGRLGEAREIMSPKTEFMSQVDGLRRWLTMTIDLALYDGDFEEALALADVLAERSRGFDNPVWASWRSRRARALDGLGRGDEATALMDEELVHARRWGAASTIGAALRVRGAVAGDPDDLREAERLLAPSGARLDHARALLALGRALDGDEAVAVLRRAHAVAVHCAAGRIAEEARDRLQALGSDVLATAATGVDALTTGERRMASLLAEGRSVRDIAQELFVTPKAIEDRLARAYAKLGVSSPEQLAGRLHAA